MVVNKIAQTEAEEFDDDGWAGVHKAAFSGYHKTVTRFISAKETRLELETLDRMQVTPLWLACKGGSIKTVDALLELGANTTVTDTNNKGIIEIAIEEQKGELVKHMINLPLGKQVWSKLFEYLSSDTQNMEFGHILLSESAKIICELSTDQQYIDCLQVNRVLEKISQLYKKETIMDAPKLEDYYTRIILNVISHTTSNIFNYSGLLQVLADRLTSDNEMIHQAILNIFKILAPEEKFTSSMMSYKGYISIIKSIENSQDEDIVYDGLTIIQISLKMNAKLQNHLQETLLLSFLLKQMKQDNLTSKLLIMIVKVLRNLSYNNPNIQQNFVTSSVFTSIHSLMEIKDKALIQEICRLVVSSVQTSSSMQAYFIKQQFISTLSTLFHRYKEDVMHVHIIKALWEIAGKEHKQQLLVVKSLSAAGVIQLATSNTSEILQFYGSEIIRVLLTLANNEVSPNGSSLVLVHLLNCMKLPALSSEMLISALKTIQKLCLQTGCRPNKNNQKILHDKLGLHVLTQVYNKAENHFIEIESLSAIAAATLCHPSNWLLAKGLINFSSKNILKLLAVDDNRIQSLTCYALSLLLLQNTAESALLQKYVKIPLAFFEQFLNSNSGNLSTTTAFQMIVLQDFITQSNPAVTALRGINWLTLSLSDKKDEVVAKSAEFINGAALFCPGVRAAFISAGVMNKLCELLSTIDDEAVKTAAAVAVVTLSHCLNGEILLLSQCRKNPSILTVIQKYAENIHLKKHFMDRWTHFLLLGIMK